MTLLRRAAIVAALTLLAVPAAASAAEPGVTPLGGHPQEVPVIDRALQNAPAGGKWVRIFFDWAQLQPADGPIDPYNQIRDDFGPRVNRYEAAGINVVGVVTRAPSWVDVNSAYGAQKYAELMTRLATEFAGEVEAWEIWNEPDEAVHWAGGPRPVEYTRMLKAAYAAVKAAAPGTRVITGGMVGNNFDFLAALYAAGAKDSFDGVGVHTDTACLLRDPGFYYREPSGRVGRYSFTGYREVYETMKANGDAAKQIWMTELGWAEAVGSGFTVLCDQGVDKGKKNGGVTRAEQAEFLKQAYACMAPDPFVKMASWFTDHDIENFRTGVHGYGLIDFDGNERPILGAMQTVGNGTGAGSNPGCGGKVDKDAPNATINIPDQYFNRLRIQGSATDPTTPVHRIELWVDGKRIEGLNQEGGKYDYDWFGSTKLAYGKHTIELRAYDEAQNMGKATKVVTKVNPATATRTVKPRVTFKARKKGRKILVKGRVLRALTGDFTEEPNGGVRIVFEWKRKKKFVQMYRTQKNVSRPIKVAFKASRPGTWRVRGILRVDAPYKNLRTKAYVLKVRR